MTNKTHDEILIKLGTEMFNITTTVHGLNIPFDEQCAIIPRLWMDAHEQGSKRIAELESEIARLVGGGIGDGEYDDID